MPTLIQTRSTHVLSSSVAHRTATTTEYCRCSPCFSQLVDILRVYFAESSSGQDGSGLDFLYIIKGIVSICVNQFLGMSRDGLLPRVYVMTEKDVENPYQATPELDTEVVVSDVKESKTRIVALATLGPIATLYTLAFLSSIELDRFTDRSLENVIFNSSVCAVIATIVLPVVWAVAGAIVRRRNQAKPSQQDTAPFLLKWIGGSVLLFATIPSIIEGFGSTYPISEFTINYYLILALALVFLLVANFVGYRRKRDQKSAFVCCLGGLMVIMAVGMLGLFFFAIAASALT